MNGKLEGSPVGSRNAVYQPELQTEIFRKPEGKRPSPWSAGFDLTKSSRSWHLAGHGKLPAGLTRDTFVSRLKTALDQVYVAADCPDPPCPPDPDPDPPAKAR